MRNRLRARAALPHVLITLGALSLVGCRSLMGPPVYPPRTPPSQPGTSQPAPETPQPQTPVPAPSTPAPSQPGKQFRLGAASSALVKQARGQSGKGDFAGATATVERALRIEPDNPLLWIELGQVHLAEGNAPQAESMGRKAVALATGDPNAQSASWRLIGDALRARGRTLDATEAYQRANLATPR